MGGHRGGQEASLLIARELASEGHSHPQAALDRANTAVYDAMQESPDLIGMGATVAGLSVRGTAAAVFNVGDARAYYFSGGYLMLVSVDDRADPSSSVISQSVGGSHRPTTIEPHLADLNLRDGDRVLLCSDGLSEVVAFESIQAALYEANITDAVVRLLRDTLGAGAPDNVSIVVVEYRNAS